MWCAVRDVCLDARLENQNPFVYISRSGQDLDRAECEAYGMGFPAAKVERHERSLLNFRINIMFQDHHFSELCAR